MSESRLVQRYGFGLLEDARNAGDTGPLAFVERRYKVRLDEILEWAEKEPGEARELRISLEDERIESLIEFLRRTRGESYGDLEPERAKACKRFLACLFEAWRSEGIAAAKGGMTEAGRAQEEAWRAVDGGKRPEDFCPPTVTREEIAAPAALSIEVGDAVYVASSIGADGIVRWSTAPPEPSGKASSRAVVTYSMDLMELHTLNPRSPSALLTGLVRTVGLWFKKPPEGSGWEALERDESKEKLDYDLIFDLMITFGLCCPVLHREGKKYDWLTSLAKIRADHVNRNGAARLPASARVIRSGSGTYVKTRILDVSADWAHRGSAVIVDGEAYGIEAGGLLLRPASMIELCEAHMKTMERNGYQGRLPFYDDNVALSIDGMKSHLDFSTLRLDHAFAAVEPKGGTLSLRDLAKLTSQAKRIRQQQYVNASRTYNALGEMRLVYRWGGAWRSVRKFDIETIHAPAGPGYTGEEPLTVKLSPTYLERMQEFKAAEDPRGLWFLMPVTRALSELPCDQSGSEALQLLRFVCSLFVRCGAVNLTTGAINEDKIPWISIDALGSALGSYPERIAEIVRPTRKGRKSVADRVATNAARNRIERAAKALSAAGLLRVEREGLEIRFLPVKEHAAAWGGKGKWERLEVRDLLPKEAPPKDDREE